jgi:hypothetical protein
MVPKRSQKSEAEDVEGLTLAGQLRLSDAYTDLDSSIIGHVTTHMEVRIMNSRPAQ